MRSKPEYEIYKQIAIDFALRYLKKEWHEKNKESSDNRIPIDDFYSQAVKTVQAEFTRKLQKRTEKQEG